MCAGFCIFRSESVHIFYAYEINKLIYKTSNYGLYPICDIHLENLNEHIHYSQKNEILVAKRQNMMYNRCREINFITKRGEKMSSKQFQGLIDQMKDAVGCEFGIIDSRGIVIAASNKENEGNDAYDVYLEISKQKGGLFIKKAGVLYEKIYIRNRLELIVYMVSNARYAERMLKLISVSVKNTKINYDEKYSKVNFIRKVITDNVLIGDIGVMAKDLDIENDRLRQVFLINVSKSRDSQVYNILCNLFPEESKEFVVVIDDENIAVVREVDPGEDRKDLNNIGTYIMNTINAEIMENVRVGISTIVENVKDLNRAYKEAEMAITVGKIFQDENRVLSYSKLGIGRLIYQLPVTLCRLFLKEIFKDGVVEALDSEMVVTIQKFFEKNLNVSETARRLFIHRNTLVYRLDKIQRLTGLDLRTFDDAIIFKVAMLVKNYLDESELIGC